MNFIDDKLYRITIANVFLSSITIAQEIYCVSFRNCSNCWEEWRPVHTRRYSSALELFAATQAKEGHVLDTGK